MNKLNLFFRLTKVDEAQRLVYGVATAETPDKTREVCDYASTVPHYKAWSDEIHKASGGKSLGNVREMHDNKAVGKLTSINFNDEEKQIEICAKIIEDSTWNKVVEGVLTGFSQGGDYEKRWKDPDDPTLTRYTAVPAEVSVVDNPCLARGSFEYIKSDGTSEMRKLNSVEPDRKEVGKLLKQVWSATDGKTFENKRDAVKHQADIDAAENMSPLEKKALAAAAAINDLLNKHEPMYWEDPSAYEPCEGELEKREFSDAKRKEMASAGTALPDGSYPIANRSDLSNAIRAIGRAKDPEKAKEHIRARAKALDAESMLPASWGGGASKKAVKIRLKKGLCEVARVAHLLAELNWVQQSIEIETALEEDESPNAAHLHEIMKEIGEFLCNLCDEETRELAEGENEDVMMPMAMSIRADHADALAKGLNPNVKSLDALRAALTKAGRRHSMADAGHLAEMKDHVEDMGDHMTKMHKMHKGMMETHEEMGEATHAEGHAEMGSHLKKLGKHIEKMDKCHGSMEECMKGLGIGSEGEGGQNGNAKEPTEKMVKLEADNQALTKTISTITGAFEALQKRLETLEQQPMQLGNRPSLFSVQKGNEIRELEEPVVVSVEGPSTNVFGSGIAPSEARRRR